MPILNQQQQDQEQQQNPQQAPQLVQPAPVTPTKQAKGSGFTNIQRIVGASQPQKLTQAVAGDIGSAVEEAKQARNQAYQSTAQQIGQQRQSFNQAAWAEKLKDPTKMSEQEKAEWAKVSSGEYVGPRGFSNLTGLLGQQQRAEQLGQAVGSSAGLGALLERQTGSQPYTAGQRARDIALLGAGGGKEQLREAAKQARGLSDVLSTQERALGAQSAEVAAANQAAAQQALSAVKSEAESTNRSINEALMKAGKERQDILNVKTSQLADYLANPNVGLPDDLKALLSSRPELQGLQLGMLTRPEALDLAKRTLSQSELTRSDIVTPEIQEKIRALAALGQGKVQEPLFGETFQKGVPSGLQMNIAALSEASKAAENQLAPIQAQKQKTLENTLNEIRALDEDIAKGTSGGSYTGVGAGALIGALSPFGLLGAIPGVFAGGIGGTEEANRLIQEKKNRRAELIKAAKEQETAVKTLPQLRKIFG